eukprot:2620798-Amphidinium_carterae.2
MGPGAFLRKRIQSLAAQCTPHTSRGLSAQLCRLERELHPLTDAQHRAIRVQEVWRFTLDELQEQQQPQQQLQHEGEWELRFIPFFGI